MSANEIEELLDLYKKSKTAKECMRYHAVLLVKTGRTIKSVSDLFFVDEENVRLCVNKWNGEEKINDKEKSGRPPKLTKEQEEEICNLDIIRKHLFT